MANNLQCSSKIGGDLYSYKGETSPSFSHAFSVKSQYALDDNSNKPISKPQLTLPSENDSLKSRVYTEGEVSVFGSNREVKVGPGLEVKKGNNSIVLEVSKKSLDNMCGVGVECVYQHDIPNTNLYAEISAEGTYYVDKNCKPEINTDIELNCGYKQSLTDNISCYGEVGWLYSSDSKKGGSNPIITCGIQSNTGFGNVYANTQIVLGNKHETIFTLGTQFNF